MLTKRIVCLANSRKHGGRCIAGRELDKDGRIGGWIRPVNREGQAVLEYECQLQDGSEPQLLDVIDIPLWEHRPENHQHENWLLGPGHWSKVDKLSWGDLKCFSETGGTLWQSYYKNDRIPFEKAKKETSSLKMIHCGKSACGLRKSKGQVRAVFHFGEGGRDSYDLAVTDPVIEQRYLDKELGYYHLGECYLTISLGERFPPHDQEEGYCYKLVAAIMEKIYYGEDIHHRIFQSLN